MNMGSAMLLYFSGIFAGIFCTSGYWWLMGRNDDKKDKSTETSTNEYLEGLATRLRSMKVILGLCRTEKETLEEAAEFISNAAEDMYSEDK